MKRTVIVVLAAILTIGLGIGGSVGCSGAGTGSDANPFADPSVANELDDGWWGGDGEDFEDEGDEIVELEESSDEPEITTTPTETVTDPLCDEELEFTSALSDQTVDVDIEITPIVIPGLSSGSGNFDWKAIHLPSGLEFNNESLTIEGTPHVVGESTVTIEVTDIDCGDHPRLQFKITVLGVAPTIATPMVSVAFPSECLSPEEPKVHLSIDGDVAMKKDTITLNSDEPAQIDIKGYNAKNPSLELELTPTISDSGDRYTFHYKRGLTTSPTVQNNEAFYLTPNLKVGNDSISLNIVAKDSLCDIKHEYTVQLNPVCRLGRLKDYYVRLTAIYKEKKDKGYCNKDGDGMQTRVGFALINDSHQARGGDESIKGGIARNSFDLTSEGNNSDHENKITDPLKKITWRGSEAVIATDSDDQCIEIDSDVQCIEEITGFGFFFEDDGCTGKPSLHVTAVEVKACQWICLIDNSCPTPPPQDEQKCYIAGWEGDYVGWKRMDDYESGTTNVTFDPLDLTETPPFWGDRLLKKVEDVFDEACEDDDDYCR